MKNSIKSTFLKQLSSLYDELELTDEDFFNCFDGVDWFCSDYENSEEFIEEIRFSHKLVNDISYLGEG